METNYIEPEGFKGTPGKWEAKRKYVYSTAESVPNNIVCFPPPNASASLEYWEANALLIAHAKELLASAQEALKELQYHNWHQTKTGLELRSVINAALGIK